MKLFKGIIKIGLSPLLGTKEIIDDMGGKNSEEEQGISILSCGLSSIIKGTAKGLKSGIKDIFED
ncbi:hypothetical protein KKE60_08010 [Patescibacteria group bacterium]|nr:hypothetical protein [Patescibacteria group bacterium]